MNKIIFLLLFSSGLALFANGFMSPIYAAFVQGIGGDLLTAGASYGAFAIAAGVLTFVLSRWEDKSKNLELLVVSYYFLAVLGYVGYLLIKNPAGLFIVQSIFGLSLAFGAPAYDSLYSKSLDKKRYASQWGLWEGMHWIVVAISASLGGFIAQTYGFRTLLVMMLVTSVTAFIVSLFLLKKN